MRGGRFFVREVFVRASSVIRVVVWSLLFIPATAAHAEDWEITPSVGYRFGGDVEEIQTSRSYDFDGAASYGLTVGRWIADEQRLELTWSRQPSGLSGIDYDVDIDYLQFAGAYEPGREKQVGGYVLASLGATRFDPAEAGAESSVFFSGSVGGGGRFRLSERLALRLEGRGYYTLTSGSTTIFCGGGCTFQLSGTGLLQLEFSAGLAIGF